MKKILHIKTSARSVENGSFSRLYGQKLLQKFYKKYEKEGVFLRDRDLMIKKPSFVSDFYSQISLYQLELTDFKKLHESASSKDLDVAKESNQIIEEFQWADEIILESPMYNFSLAANLKAYFDLLIALNKTFTSNYKGLVLGKKIYVISSCGGSGYETDKSYANFHTPFLKFLLKFIGFKEDDIKFLFIEKTSTSQADTSHADNFLESFL